MYVQLYTRRIIIHVLGRWRGLPAVAIHYKSETAKQSDDAGETKKREQTAARRQTGQIKTAGDEDQDAGLREVSSRQRYVEEGRDHMDCGST